MTLLGVDLSNHNSDRGAVDFAALKAGGCDFALLKATVVTPDTYSDRIKRSVRRIRRQCDELALVAAEMERDGL